MRALRWGGALGAVPAQAAWRAGRARRGVRPAVQLLLLGGSVPQPQDAAVVPLPRPQGLARRRGGAGCGDEAEATATRQLTELFGVSRRTVRRWRTWWGSAFAASPFWKLAAAAFMPPVDCGRLPASLLGRFAGDAAARLVALLRFILPISGGAAM